MEPRPQDIASRGGPAPLLPESGIHPRPPSEPAGTGRRWRPSNLTLRLLTASALIPPVLFVCYTGGPWFVAVIILISVLGINEFYNFISQKGANAHRLMGTAAAAVLPVVVYFGDAFLATNFLTAVLLTTMVLQLTKQQIREAIASVSATFFGIFYVGWLLSHAISIRFIHGTLVTRYGDVAAVSVDPEIGFFFIVLCLASALGCDAGAYFVGRRYGRHRLAPTISPNKSMEGAIGGILLGGVLGAAVKLFYDSVWPGALSQNFPVEAAVAFGVAVAAAGILGDLIESVLKRDADLKDAGSLLPGVGGVLDRIDSALLAFPVMYYMLLAYYYFRFA